MKRFSCDEVVELVTAYLEGDLDETTRCLFAEHLSGCEGCARYLGQIRATADALGALGASGPGAGGEPSRPPSDGLPRSARERLLGAFREHRRS
ncbi:anti-sigma factor family protein [Streptosporangium sandarakinum]|uniref:Anti-sigma factor RsiW n=1 Tax=Streptosporangium sandarakinum TaxID=1260955 RepID=A0A852V845_9ACTN|nr:zf-HC2 domain-containing protein [Streptosporangium sandarakinum]NYF44266.1 anti-sigma factor RsiW [Streptosporangium sandarakinum]